MKLSIITINLNNASGLRKTIESVISQTYYNIEYIIIDGASKDESVKVIKEYENKISFWISETDRGIYHAMNKGILKAKGDYCQFLNSGDILVNQKVTEKMIKDMPNCSIVYGNMIKEIKKNRTLHNKQVDTQSFLTFYKSTLNHSSAYIKRTLFEKYGLFDETLKIVSDWKFFLLTIGLHNETVAYRDIDVTRFNMIGISNTNSQLDKKERSKVLKELIPESILYDYRSYTSSILKMKRINRFKLTKWSFWFFERILFKIEKLETRIKGKHISY